MPNELTYVTPVNPAISKLEVASANLLRAIREATQAARAVYADAEVGDMYLQVLISGRTHGDLKVEFQAGSLYHSNVEAYDLNTAVLEFLRRQGWDSAHKPTLITYHGDEKGDTI